MGAKVAPPDYFTTAEVAKRLGCCEETVRRWARSGKLRHFRFDDRHGLRFTEEHITELLAGLERKPMPAKRGRR